MDARTKKLVKHYKLSGADAQALIDAGLSTPKLIRAAKDNDIKALKGIGQAALDDIRGKVG